MTNEQKGLTRHRSPAYPALSLRSSVAKAGVIHETHRRAVAAEDVVKRAMGYDTATSHGTRAISALIQYGLIEPVGAGGARRLKLSDSFLNILLRGDGDPERARLLREAALRPTVYREMFARWGGTLPADGEISNFLLFERRFNPHVVAQLVRDFRDTHAFAGLDASPPALAAGRAAEPAGPSVRPGAGRSDAAPEGDAAGPSAPPDATEAAVPYRMPLRDGREAVVLLPRDVRIPEIDVVIRFLALMKEALSEQ